MYTIPENYTEELQQYRLLTEEVLKGKGDALSFKIFRVTRGVYEQRTPNTYMIRVRCSGGVISPKQLLKVVEIAEKYSPESIHITTRQEIQLHNIQLKDTPAILEALYKAGLSTKGSGGNTVRNITASIESGIADEVFDIMPYNIALANELINYEKSFELPRKLKIAFSCSEKDSALASFSDIGFIAKIKDGVKGFKVLIGGSPSTKPKIGEVLFDFIPAEQILGVALAVVEMFYIHGNRKERSSARLRHLFYKLGKQKVFDLFFTEYETFKHKTLTPVSTQPFIYTDITQTSKELLSNDCKIWLSQYAKEQIQKGYYTIEIPVLFGNFSLAQIKAIAEFASEIHHDTIRLSRRQSIHLRNIPYSSLSKLYAILQEIKIETSVPYTLNNMVSCTGADTCQLGICFSKGGLKAVYDELKLSEAGKTIKKVDINFSGCPNACGQHLVADLGFAGKISRNGHFYPAYSVYAGTQRGEQSALPEKIGEIAAKDMPRFTRKLMEIYADNNSDIPFYDFIHSHASKIEKLFSEFSSIPSIEENNDYYIDWGNNDLFSTVGRRRGECSASTLDMIEAEINVIEKCNQSITGQQEVEEQIHLLHQLVYSASKLLYLTKERRLVSDKKLYKMVNDTFFGLSEFESIKPAILNYASEGNFSKLLKAKEDCIIYANTAVEYYKNLNDNYTSNKELGRLSVSDLKVLADLNSNFALIDVREEWEKKSADIGGLLIPLNEIESRTEEIPRNKNIIVYCKDGSTSIKAVETLTRKYNFTNVFNLEGGITAWANEIDSSVPLY